ncbi:hypothetical protein [Flavobacterium sp. GP15]|uniref:hypothetical protein n=1 Tax=Flavobacterium sp. GP15 TaxID=2758567 RepID=UPI00165EB8D5|nr:hypothetical protein [Flavobacterium sp. GP15]
MDKSYLLLLTLIFLPFYSFAQSDINIKANEGAAFICNCTNISLIKNDVDVVKLVEIYNSYKPNKVLSKKYHSDVKRISRQLDSKYSLIEKDIFTCRDQFKVNYKAYFTKDFLNKLEVELNNNPYSNGPKTIKDLA